MGFGGAAVAAEQQDREEDLLPSRPRPHIHVGWLAATTPPPSPGRGGDGWQGAGAATPASRGGGVTGTPASRGAAGEAASRGHQRRGLWGHQRTRSWRGRRDRLGGGGVTAGCGGGGGVAEPIAARVREGGYAAPAVKKKQAITAETIT